MLQRSVDRRSVVTTELNRRMQHIPEVIRAKLTENVCQIIAARGERRACIGIAAVVRAQQQHEPRMCGKRGAVCLQ